MASNILNSSQHFNVGVGKHSNGSSTITPSYSYKNYYLYNVRGEPKHCYFAIGHYKYNAIDDYALPFFLFTTDEYHGGVLESMVSSRPNGIVDHIRIFRHEWSDTIDFLIKGSVEKGFLASPASASAEYEISLNDIINGRDEYVDDDRIPKRYKPQRLKVLQEVELNPSNLIEPINKFLIQW